MTTSKPKNISASVRQRLFNLAQTSTRPFQEILQYYMMERFIDRFSRSSYKNKFILKGGLMFSIWNLSASRPTRDIDFSGITSNNPKNIHKIITNICQINSNDGVAFLDKTIECEPIQEQNEYTGIRSTFLAELDKSKIKMQIDIGFGDIIYPDPIAFEYPTLLDMPSPRVKGYTPETLISENLHTMFRHGIANSRMKDIYDIWLLSRQFTFSGDRLSEAIEKTFHNRGMEIKEQEPLIFSNTFKNDQTKNQQWNAFINKNTLSTLPNDFIEAMDQIEPFIAPILYSYKSDKNFDLVWHPPGPWTA